jgi:deoxycytidylate deaminase
MNAILNAARNGIQLLGCALYCTLPPCVGCAKAIIQSGIDRVVVPAHELQKLRNPNFLEQLEWVDWRKDFVIADIMFEEAGVKLVGF